MIATIKFTKHIDSVPENCVKCPFVDICDAALPGITKSGGMEYTVAASRHRHKQCPLHVEEER